MPSFPPSSGRSNAARTAHTDALLQQFAALSPAEQSAIELIALCEQPIRLQSLFELLRLAELDPAWRETNVAGLMRLLLRLHSLLIDPRAADLRAQGGEALQRAALRSLVDSGRALRVAAALLGPQHAALERIEPEYRSGLRLRLRMAGLLAGMAPEQLNLGSFVSGYSDPVGEALWRLVALFGPGDIDSVERFHPSLRPRVLGRLAGKQLLQAVPGDAALLARIGSELGQRQDADAQMLHPWQELQMLHGRFDLAATIDEAFGSLHPAALAAQQLHAGAATDEVLPLFDAALRELRSIGGPKALQPGLLGKLHLACLSLSRDPKQIKRREQLAKLRDPMPEALGGIGFELWQTFTRARQAGQVFIEPAEFASPRLDDAWWLGLLLHWSGQTPSSALRAAMQQAQQHARLAGWDWLVQQLAALLQPDSSDAQLARPPIRDWLTPQAAWQTALDALAQALAGSAPSVAPASSAQSQLRVLVDALPQPNKYLRIDLIEQRRKGDGWSAGRSLATAAPMRNALDRLPAGDDPDRQLLTALLAEPAAFNYGRVDAGSRAVAALIGHPRVYLDGETGDPIQVVAGEVELTTRRLPDGRIDLRLNPPAAAEGEPLVWLRGRTLAVYRSDNSLRRIGEIVGSGIALPEEAVSRLLDLLPALARKLKLNADLSDLGVAERAAERGLVAQLEPYRDGLAVHIVVRPLGSAGAAFAPGQAPASVLGQHDGRPLRAERDLAGERAAEAALRERCPRLCAADPGQRLELDDPEAALDLLAELQEQPELALEWRAGKPLRVARTRAQAALQLKVSNKRDWFAAEGGVALDDGSVVALADVLRALGSSQGRYLRLDEQRVVELDAELRRRLQTLRSFADHRGQVQVPSAAAFALEAVLDESSECDRGFRQQLQRMEQANTLQPAVPANFQAELRDYQIDGYRFLMRLAAWGGGACLADDMGLGKTVQTLAMLTARAGEGVALVVAPTSVLGNWRREALRFAPDLVVRGYADGDREATLRELQPGDVLLVSYGMLAANIDALEAVQFASLVLDEAQAIKNASTQRAQAVRRINAGFRMAATGTPLENHLGELWSLFRVLNPGLLGSEEQFRKRFLQPLERDPRAPQRDLLRRLLAPFLLRRTKAEVLSELPPRTEIVLTVEPSQAEAQLQAALRRQALERLGSDSLPSEQRRVHILAELTRLRRAACHPQLVAPELGLASSKLEQLIELVRELVDNRHRALVFSQFVDYLGLLRQRLDAEGIRYQYLDGSTPIKAREAAVNAFQRGDGELFLLSLKAGGVGLNLTAADYVIHLDPWWNPAVEAQASDRAHRIGQTRPVTVYKLVLAGSIEEQILALHGSKRELIDQVIGEAGGGAPLGLDELLGLLEDAAPSRAPAAIEAAA